MADLESIILRAGEKLGYACLREKQISAVKSFVEGKDVFIILPTGSGKSLCFWVLPFVFDDLYKRVGSIVIVVSPLIALMKDQVSALISKGLSAAHLSSEMDYHTHEEKVIRGEIQIVFIGPEQLLLNSKWREMLRLPVYQSNLVAFVVDEAHCISKWGDRFRKEFKRLGIVRSLIPSHVHVMAMTATATTATRESVIATLGLVEPIIVSSSPDKPNMSFFVKEKRTIESVFMPLVTKLLVERSAMPRVIIFCRTYEECSELYMFFESSMKKNFTEPIGAPNLSVFRLVDMFTAVTRKNIKDTIIASFSVPEAPLRIVISTLAFGMGIDCTDVNEVIHWGPSSNIESYVQECGRGGRNGLPSRAVLFWKKSDFLYASNKDIELYCRAKDVCRRQNLMSHFGFAAENIVGCNCCDVCALNCNCKNCNCALFAI